VLITSGRAEVLITSGRAEVLISNIGQSRGADNIGKRQKTGRFLETGGSEELSSE
jgi:hypothetical protein